MPNGLLSAAQEAIVVDQLRKPDASNSTATVWRIRGTVDVDRLVDVVTEVFDDTPALHVAFVADEASELQAIGRTPGDWSPEFHDVSGTEPAKEHARDVILGLCSTPFDLAEGNLFRVALVRVAEDEYILGMILHHVLTDAYGVFDVLSQRVAAAYRGQPVPAPRGPAAGPVAGGLRDEAYRKSELFGQDADYWQEYLGGARPAARLPKHGIGTPDGGARLWDCLGAPLGVSSSTVAIPREQIAQALSNSAAPDGVSFPDLLMASVVGFISRACDSDGFTFSFTVNFRSGAYRKSPGLYSNAVPMSVSVSPAGSTVDLARQLGAERLDLLQHAEYNVALMKRVSGRAGGSRSPFGPVVNVLPFLTQLDFGTATGTLEGGMFGVPDEVMISVFNDGSPTSDLFVRLDAPADIYTPSDVRALGDLLAHYVAGALRSPHEAIGSVPLTPETHVSTLTGRVAADDGVPDVENLLAARAARSPQEIAVTDGTASLSHSELLEQARSVRNLLTRAGVGAQDVVAVAVPTGIPLVPVQVGLVMSGAVTVPVAPGASLDSLTGCAASDPPGWLVSLAGIDEIVVTPVVDGAPVWSRSVTSADAADAAGAEPPVETAVDPAGACYVGSGARLTRSGLHALVQQTVEALGIGHGDTVLVRRAGWEFLCAVTAGASIAVLSRPSSDVAPSVAFLAAGEVADWSAHGGTAGSPRAVVHGGEPLPAGARQAWVAAGGGTLYVGVAPSADLPPFALTSSSGGPTEEVLAGSLGVLDGRRAPVGQGFVGRLHAIVPTSWASSDLCVPVDRPGDAPQGAWNAVAAFELPQLAGVEQGRLRPWGDSRRTVTTPGGTLFLAEVDRVAESFAGVAEAVSRTAPAESSASRPHLTLYVVPAARGLLGGAGGSVSFDAGVDIAAVRRLVGALVAGVATVGDVIVVDSIPRTTEGLAQLDALPVGAPEPVGARASTEQEQRVVDLFGQVLGRSDVKAGDDFFELGGDSIMAMRLASRARQTGLALAVRDIFEHRTVENLAALVAAEQNVPRLRAVQELPPSEYPLPPIAYVFDRSPAFDRFAQWMAVTTPRGLTRELLVAVLQQLVDRHDALRSRRVETTMQVSEPGVTVAGALLEVVMLGSEPASLSPSDLDAYAASATAQIDARQGDLVRFVWLAGPAGSAGLLVVAFHHLVIDAVSWQIVLDDLATVHQALDAGLEPEPVGSPVSFAEWVRHAYGTLGTDDGEGRAAWEQEIFDGRTSDGSVLDPQDDVTTTADRVRVELDRSLSDALGTWVAERLGCGTDDLLLAAYAMAVPQSADGPVVVRMEGHGRDGALPDGRDGAQTVGWFTTVHPVRIDVSDLVAVSDPRVVAAQAVARTRQGRAQLLRRDWSYALQAYAPQGLHDSGTHPPADQLGFNYLGRFGATGQGEAWSPASQTPVIVPAPDTLMPLAAVLNLDAASVVGQDAEVVEATFTYATRHLSRAAVQQVAETWVEMLETFRDLAADERPVPIDGSSELVSGQEWASLTERYGPIECVWPLTPLQQGLYYHWLRSDNLADAYRMQFAFALQGKVDVTRLQRATEAVVRRLPNLRVAFVGSRSGEPRQVVLPEVSVPFGVVDLRADIAAEAQLETLLAQERRVPFDLATPPALRFTTYLLSDETACLGLTAHHILLDGWSLPLLLTEILWAYAREDAYDITPDVRFENALRHGLSVDRSAATAAWQEELRGAEAPLLASQGGGGRDEPEIDELGEVDVAVPREAALRVAATAAQLGVTTSAVLQAAWALTLSWATGSEDVVFANTVAVRPSEVDGVSECIGMLTNTVPVRARVGLDLTLGDLARDLQETGLRTMDHWHVGLGDILATTNGQELFDSIVVFESFPIDQSNLHNAGRAAGLDVTGITPFAPTHYPYTLLAAADPVLSATLQYRGGPARREHAERLADCLAAVLHEFVESPAARVAELGRVTPAEYEHLVRSVNETSGVYPDATVAEQFADRAREHGNDVAVVHGTVAWTYADLDREAGRICSWLRELGVGRGDKVAVALPRSTTCIAAVLGLWRAGAVYVPVDPQLPSSRYRGIIEDSAPVVVITEDLVDARPWRDAPVDSTPERIAAAEPAYAFFTSGSTGRPKGVLVPHEALTNLLAGMQQLLPVTPQDRWLSVTTISFDISLLELFQPLVGGAAVVIADTDVRRDPARVWELVRDAGVTTMQATPSLWRSLCSDDTAGVDGLRALVGGEALDADLAERLGRRAEKVLNVYGPTETTVWSTCGEVPGNSRTPTIGRPIQNTQVYVLDQALRPLPVGHTGELWIAGTGMALGYFNSPMLTASRFVANPFGTRPGTRMYRTGDLARWTDDGRLEFVGRNDTQVKVRGLRIELAEVERLLTGHRDVRQAVVCLNESEDGRRRLVAYLILDDPGLDHPRDLTTYLNREVPEHMRPAVTVVLESFPLTPNGKVDRKRLPEPDVAAEPYVAPSSDLQATLCRLFAEVLGLERVGVKDEFVALGGHSLTATRLVSRIRTETGVEVPIGALFGWQTVDQLSSRWQEFGASRRRAIGQKQ